jgi:hypothetical protein
VGFNRRKMKDQRRQAAEKEAADRRATDAQVLEDAERLITTWNDRQAKRMPMLFSPTIGAAITAGYWFLWVRCPACRTTSERERLVELTNEFIERNFWSDRRGYSPKPEAANPPRTFPGELEHISAELNRGFPILGD